MKAFLLMTFTVASLMVNDALAQDSINYIEARQNIMKFIGSQMRPLGSMSQGGIDFNANQVRISGQAIAMIAGTYPLLFPLGTESGGKTAAAQSIFDNPEGFAALAAELRSAGELVQQSGSAEQLQQSFASLAATCKACHGQFRN